MHRLPVIPLSDGSRLPSIGFGTYPLRGTEGTAAIVSALAAGYRLIDSAVRYDNEDAVAAALRESNVPRSEIIVQSKLAGADHGYEETLAAVERSRQALGVEVIDSYLIHWPNPNQNRYVDSWRALIELRERGVIRSIGVSNFTRTHLERLAAETGVLPAVNQIELHPLFPQEDLLRFHEDVGVVTQAWSPLGKASAPYAEPVITRAALAHGATPAQVILRWHLQRGSLPLPKSAHPDRQAANLALGGFVLTDEEVAGITALGRPDGRLFGADPNTHEEF